MYLYGHSMGGLVAVASVLRKMTLLVLVDFLIFNYFTCHGNSYHRKRDRKHAG